MDAKENEEVADHLVVSFLVDGDVDGMDTQFKGKEIKRKIAEALDTKDKRIKEQEESLKVKTEYIHNQTHEIIALKETIEVLSDGTGARVLKEQLDEMKQNYLELRDEKNTLEGLLLDMKDGVKALEEKLAVAVDHLNSITELKPSYKPEMKFGWVRTFVARRLKARRFLKQIKGEDTK